MLDLAEWNRCGPWLQAALDHAGNTHALDNVREMVERGEAQFWPASCSAVVTEIIEYPRCKALRFWLVGGDLAELRRIQPVIEAWGRHIGCARAEGAGRRGWERALRDYRQLAVMYTKEL